MRSRCLFVGLEIRNRRKGDIYIQCTLMLSMNMMWLIDVLPKLELQIPSHKDTCSVV